tara:strand:+ start:649 stop:957 length:309 start_codon:yes stop_codon:yes gene_type:complete
MSKVLLSLVDQKYKKKISSSRDQIIRDLRSEVSGYEVNFLWNSRYEKPSKVYHMQGQIVSAGLDAKNEITLVIEFENPETNSSEKVVRYINELKWAAFHETA